MRQKLAFTFGNFLPKNSINELFELIYRQKLEQSLLLLCFWQVHFQFQLASFAIGKIRFHQEIPRNGISFMLSLVIQCNFPFNSRWEILFKYLLFEYSNRNVDAALAGQNEASRKLWIFCRKCIRYRFILTRTNWTASIVLSIIAM